MTEPDEDAPRPRGTKSDGTRFEAAATRPHQSASTQVLPYPHPRDPKLREHSAPIPIVHMPTVLLPPPSGAIEIDGHESHDPEQTRRVPSSPTPVAGAIDRGPDRCGDAAHQLQGAIEVLNVDRRPLVSQLFSGLAAGLTAGPTTGSLEFLGKSLVTTLLVAETGAGGAFNDDRLGHHLMELAVQVLTGVDAFHRAATQIARDSDEKAAHYETLARQAMANGNISSAVEWKARADERRCQAIDLRRSAR